MGNQIVRINARRWFYPTNVSYFKNRTIISFCTYSMFNNNMADWFKVDIRYVVKDGQIVCERALVSPQNFFEHTRFVVTRSKVIVDITGQDAVLRVFLDTDILRRSRKRSQEEGEESGKMRKRLRSSKSAIL